MDERISQLTKQRTDLYKRLYDAADELEERTLNRELDGLENQLARLGVDVDRLKTPKSPKSSTTVERKQVKLWEPPTFDNFDWSLLADDNAFQEKQNAEKKKARRQAERPRLLAKGMKPAEIRALWKKRDNSNAGRPALKLNNAVYNNYMKKLILTDENYFSTPRLWDLIQDDPNKPEGLSKRYVDRLRRAFEVLEVHRRWVEDPDILRRVPKSGESARFITWFIDLKTMREQNGYNYILVVTDGFSKYLWTKKMKNKEQNSTLDAFKSIFNGVDQALRARRVHSDLGSEFGLFKAWLAQRNVQWTVSPPGRPQANGQAERAVATVGRLVSQYEKQTGKKDWPTALPRLVANYNATKAAATGLAPNKVQSMIKAGEEDQLNNIADSIRKAAGLGEPGPQPNRTAEPKFQRGDVVRFRLGSGAGLAKSGGWNWSSIPAKISEREASQKTGIIRYKLEDQYGEPINTAQGPWWSNDQLILYVPSLHKMRSDPVWIIRSILRPAVYQRGKVKEPDYLVSWVGFGRKDNSIEPRRVLMEDIPSWLTSFEARNKVK